MFKHFYIGVDLGQSEDYSTYCIIEEKMWVESTELPRLRAETGITDSGWRSPLGVDYLAANQIRAENYHRLTLPDPKHHPVEIKEMHRFDLGTPYPDIVEHLVKKLSSPPLAGYRKDVVVDYTGVGRGVVDYLHHAGMRPIAVGIHGGDKVTRDRQNYQTFRVPKRDLVTEAKMPLQRKLVRAHPTVPHLSTLFEEMRHFTFKIDPRTAHDSYSHWRERDHDDIVLAFAMALWWRAHYNASVASGRASAMPLGSAGGGRARVPTLRELALRGSEFKNPA